MASQYKLTYFNRGRGEPIRLIFALANVPYENNIIQGVNWPTIKPTTPWGQVPVLEVLEVDGVKISQTMTICRFLARRFNLAGANELEATTCDELVDALLDIYNEWMKAYFGEKDEVRKAEFQKNLKEASLPKYLAKLEQVQADNGGNFLVGRSATWADALEANFLERLEGTVGPNVLDAYPNLKNLKSSFLAIPSVKAYVDVRPPS